jgi:hypothetical protein
LIDILTVNETANEPPPEDGTMDSAKNLGMEAVFINHNFTQQVLKMVIKNFLQINQSILFFFFFLRTKNDTNFQIQIHSFNPMKKMKQHQLHIVIVHGI